MDLVHPDVNRWLDRNAETDDPVLLEMERIAAVRKFPIVGPQVGRLLEVLARACGARTILELGSGFGYSAYWLLRATAPEGEVVLTEGSSERADEARAFLERGGFAGRFRIEVGDAFAAAEKLSGPFDLLLNDVDKHDYGRVHDVAARLLRPGGLLVSDNMLWRGKVTARVADDAATEGVLDLHRLLRESGRFAAATVPSRDGVTVAVRLAGEVR